MVDYYSSDVLRSSSQEGSYLSGLPIPETEAPPLPYTTTPAPPTTPAPTCAPPLEFVPSTLGLRFGDTDVSYAAFETNAEENIFLNA